MAEDVEDAQFADFVEDMLAEQVRASPFVHVFTLPL